MVVKYDNENVKKLFEDLNNIGNSRNLILRKVGPELTKIIKKRFNQISSFDSFFELQSSGIGKCESLDGDLKGFYKLSLTANNRLIIKPCTEDLSVEGRKKCDILIIKGVCDYHGTKTKWIIP